MIGIDLTKISRFNNPKDTFIKKVLHKNEIEEYRLSINKPKFLAAHWAIKEAIFKIDNSLSNFSKIEITKKNRVYQYPGYIITTTNEDDYYNAMVIKEK